MVQNDGMGHKIVYNGVEIIDIPYNGYFMNMHQ